MKPVIKAAQTAVLIASVLFSACSKPAAPVESLPITSTSINAGKAPAANAGTDTTILLPVSQVLLDAGKSVAFANTIKNFVWRKIAGPASFAIKNSYAAQTTVTNLVEGVYQFEIKVTDAAGLFSADTIMIIVNNGYQHWVKLHQLPEKDFFFGPRPWFNGATFLLGIDNDVFAVNYRGNILKYNPSGDAWELSGFSFPEEMQKIPVAFSVGGKGYCLGNGHCWQYDPARGQWLQKTDPPPSLQDPLVINNIVYMRNASNQLRAYNPITDTYSRKNEVPDLDSVLAGLFVVNGKGYYIGSTGKSWKYDPLADTWQQAADLTAAAGINNTSSFSTDSAGYIIGDLNSGTYNDNLPMRVWRYDPVTDKWEQSDTNNYPGLGAYKISTVSVKGTIYVGLGFNNGDFNAIDFWKFR